MRIPLVDVESSQFERHRREGRTPGHLIRTVAHTSPEALQAWIGLAWALRKNTALSDARRELITVRVTQLARCEYEFSHHFEEALTVGLGRDELDDLATWRDSSHFDDTQRALLAYVDELVTSSSVTDDTFARLEAALGENSAQQMVDITMVVGFYGMVAKVLNAFETPLEADRPAHSVS
jgi:4-carboxymuconolactone decarboxylase